MPCRGRRATRDADLLECCCGGSDGALSVAHLLPQLLDVQSAALVCDARLVVELLFTARQLVGNRLSRRVEVSRHCTPYIRHINDDSVHARHRVGARRRAVVTSLATIASGRLPTVAALDELEPGQPCGLNEPTLVLSPLITGHGGRRLACHAHTQREATAAYFLIRTHTTLA